MGDMFDYISWRGDIPFSSVSLTQADALILSTLVYLDFQGIVREDMEYPVPLHVAAAAFSSLPDANERLRRRSDLALLKAAADSPRFRNMRLCFYRTRLIEAEETQFAALAFLLDDGTAFLSFRGTDDTLIGWKEDFNMSFQDTVPAQREATEYVRAFAENFPLPLQLGGHSKGGNLSVFSAAQAPADIQLRILDVYNLDGPGFSGPLLRSEGYLRVAAKIHTFIPQSSIIGILLEHEESYTVIKSRQVGILQHEPYSWEIMGGSFVQVDGISSGSQFADRTIRTWIRDMSKEDREVFIDAVFQLLSTSGATQVSDLLQPKNIHAFFKALRANEQTKRLLSVEFIELLRAARNTLTTKI